MYAWLMIVLVIVYRSEHSQILEIPFRSQEACQVAIPLVKKEFERKGSPFWPRNVEVKALCIQQSN